MTTIQIHLNAAIRNQAIAQSLRTNPPPEVVLPPYEWVVVLYFYSAVRYINAYLLTSGHQPVSHAQRKRLIADDPVLQAILVSYGLLESRSRRARYEAAPEAFSMADLMYSEHELAQIRRRVTRALQE